MICEERPDKLESQFIRNAIGLGNLEVVKYVYEHQVRKRRFDFSGSAEAVAMHGRVDVLLWLCEKGATHSLSTAKIAARNGNRNVLNGSTSFVRNWSPRKP